jgi:hypothetical protein
LKTHLVDTVALVVQSIPGSKTQGIRAFVLNASRSLGRHLYVLEIKAQENPQSSYGPAPSASMKNQDAEGETRLLKLETFMDDAGYNKIMGQNDGSKGNPASLVAARIEEWIDSMDIKIENLFAKGDGICIKFAGLGFTKPIDASSWFEKELPHHPAGLIVDPHMVLKRVFCNMDNTDTLVHLWQL